jgi:hypothetical protein
LKKLLNPASDSSLIIKSWNAAPGPASLGLWKKDQVNKKQTFWSTTFESSSPCSYHTSHLPYSGIVCIQWMFVNIGVIFLYSLNKLL